jgi:hypothetical protein
MAVLVGASVYAMTGTSNAASTPQSPKAGVVSKAGKTVPVEIHVMSKAGKTIRVEAGVARVVQVGSAGVKQAGAAAPNTLAGPGSACMDYYHYSFSAGPGSYGYVTFPFSSSPFVIGSMFNETTQTRYAEESEYQSGTNVTVTVLNNGSGTETLSGYYGVLYYPISGGC